MASDVRRENPIDLVEQNPLGTTTELFRNALYLIDLETHWGLSKIFMDCGRNPYWRDPKTQQNIREKIFPKGSFPICHIHNKLLACNREDASTVMETYATSLQGWAKYHVDQMIVLSTFDSMKRAFIPIISSAVEKTKLTCELCDQPD